MIRASLNARFGYRLPFDLEEQQPVEEQVDLGVGDRPVAQQRALWQAVLAVVGRYQDGVGQGSLGR